MKLSFSFLDVVLLHSDTIHYARVVPFRSQHGPRENTSVHIGKDMEPSYGLPSFALAEG